MTTNVRFLIEIWSILRYYKDDSGKNRTLVVICVLYYNDER